MRKKLDRLELNLKLQAVALESLLEDIKEIQNKLSEIENRFNIETTTISDEEALVLMEELLSGEEHN